MDKPIATGRVSINASPAEVYRHVSDPTVMVEFAEELFQVRWVGEAKGAMVGARFEGTNRNGWRRWVTTCLVTEAKPGERFAYEVSTRYKVPISRWAYDIQPEGEGCTVTQTSWLRVPPWFIPVAIMITGEPNRAGVNRANIATTLGRLKEHVESGH